MRPMPANSAQRHHRVRALQRCQKLTAISLAADRYPLSFSVIPDTDPDSAHPYS
jgi:hypothetical protein